MIGRVCCTCGFFALLLIEFAGQTICWGPMLGSCLISLTGWDWDKLIIIVIVTGTIQHDVIVQYRQQEY